MVFGKPGCSFPLVEQPAPVFTMNHELRHSNLYSASSQPNNSFTTLVYFQFVFTVADITLVLIAASLLGRVQFLAWMVFVPFWVTFLHYRAQTASKAEAFCSIQAY